ncbi:hypothetical protein CRG98_005122 [Punica granatum]|uniref:Uncharacterized protein n=1 Tax=Punica granatum TaxID=22663 RepID=A0A2I0L1B0_PUNGR|nr:hypothetical protein CRG98_005122 [Punica granatum]
MKDKLNTKSKPLGWDTSINAPEWAEVLLTLVGLRLSCAWPASSTAFLSWARLHLRLQQNLIERQREKERAASSSSKPPRKENQVLVLSPLLSLSLSLSLSPP